MAKTLNDIGSAIPDRGSGGIRAIGLVIEKKPFPDGESQADVEGPMDPVFPVLLIDRPDPIHQVEIQRIQVLVRDFRIRGIRHGRIQTVPVPVDSVPHGPDELDQGVAPDPGVAVGGDIGRIKNAERGVHGGAAGQRLPTAGRVAGKTIAHMGQIFSLPNRRRIGECGGCAGPDRLRLEEECETGSNHKKEKNERQALVPGE